MPGQQAQHEGAQHIAFVRCVATAVRQGALRHPAIEHAGGCQELRKKDQLTMRRGRSPLVPAHMHAPSQRIHHLGANFIACALDQGSLSLAS